MEQARQRVAPLLTLVSIGLLASACSTLSPASSPAGSPGPASNPPTTGTAGTPAPTTSAAPTGSGSPAGPAGPSLSASPSTSASGPSSTAPPTVLPTDPGTGVDPNAQPPSDTVPITALAPGETPPQFVVVSFDGACRPSLFQHYLDLGAATGARFTFFLSGLCLVPESQRGLYHPPHRPVGTSNVGFASASLVPLRIRLMSRAYRDGYEIGTHFLGHFCNAPSVGTWTSADWSSELTQATYFLDHWAEINHSTDPSLKLPFSSADWKGDRTPCLLGIPSQMYPVFAKAGFSYDASGAGSLVWPRRTKGFPLWAFPLQRIHVIGYGKSNLSMDYNLLYVQNHGNPKADPATCARIEESTYQSYLQALVAVRGHGRAPLFVGNHFNDWACNAYTTALTRFVTTAHQTYPDVRFVTFAYLARWLDAQRPEVLRALQSRPAPSY
jgi:hypothetical protein